MKREEVAALQWQTMSSSKWKLGENIKIKAVSTWTSKYVTWRPHNRSAQHNFVHFESILKWHSSSQIFKKCRKQMGRVGCSSVNIGLTTKWSLLVRISTHNNKYGERMASLNDWARSFQNPSTKPKNRSNSKF